ncbi:MAG: hypothetical protein QOD60_1771 [Solirubrobacterales bacterium]|jgi:hypothetical protein|nr:hypothetical protein [Solirubrobacterales bacterium]
MIGRVRAFGAFLYDFVIGDDPAIAIAVVLALALAGLLAAWWVLPPVVVGVLGWSLVRAT